VTAPRSDRRQVFVILRADLFQAAGTPVDHIVSAKEIVHSLSLAQSEVDRPNALQPDGNVKYWFTPSRFYPLGTSAGSSEAPT